MKYLSLCEFANMIAKALKNISEAVFKRKTMLCKITQIFLKIFFEHFAPQILLIPSETALPILPLCLHTIVFFQKLLFVFFYVNQSMLSLGFFNSTVLPFFPEQRNKAKPGSRLNKQEFSLEGNGV